MSEHTEPQQEPEENLYQAAFQYADYILNHYSKSSGADKELLAKDLIRHGWSDKKSAT